MGKVQTSTATSPLKWVIFVVTLIICVLPLMVTLIRVMRPIAPVKPCLEATQILQAETKEVSPLFDEPDEDIEFFHFPEEPTWKSSQVIDAPLNVLLSEVCPLWNEKFGLLVPWYDIDKITNSLTRWNQPEFYPCSENATRSYEIIFYLQGQKDIDGDAKEGRITSALGKAAECFSAVRFVSSEVVTDNVAQWKIATDSFYKWFQLMEDADWPYASFFLMEWDAWPIRSNWVQQLFVEAACRSPFWVKGSSRYDNDWPKYKANGIYSNGNAMYNCRDEYFVRSILPEARHNTGDSYEIALYRCSYPHPIKKKQNMDHKRRYFSQYQHLEFIQNWEDVEVSMANIKANHHNVYVVRSDKEPLP